MCEILGEILLYGRYECIDDKMSVLRFDAKWV